MTSSFATLLVRATAISKDGYIVSTTNLPPATNIKQRRSQRIFLSVHLQVSGKQKNGKTFVEHTTTLIVSAHGAFIHLQEPVLENQLLTIKHDKTGEEIACRVVSVNAGANGLTKIAVEFTRPKPRFWRIAFPPDDWSTKSPEAKRPMPDPGVAPKPANSPVEKK
jgi:hypothetical protein